MGHGSSKSSSSDDSTNGGVSNCKSSTSRRERIKKKLHLHRRRGRPAGSSRGHSKLSSLEDFTGIALVTLISAEMKFKDKWLACVSIGEQTFRTETSDQTNKPTWNSEKKFLLERNGPHIAKISVFETNRLSKNNLIGYCEVDLFEFLSQDSGFDTKMFDLLDPSSSSVVVGNISLSCSVEDPTETEKSFARRILSIVGPCEVLLYMDRKTLVLPDYNGDGQLSFSEFSELINAFGNQQAAKKKEELFKAADENGDGVVSMDELATLLAVQQEKEPLINCCPVCGEFLEVSDKLNSMIHMSLCFDEGTGNQVMTGGFLTDKQASYGWMFKLTEWAHVSSYDAGLNSGSSASHIVVFDRRKKRLVEEIIDGKIVLSMRAIYQSKVGLGIMDKGAKELLQSISEKQGKKMNSVESAKDIPDFLKFFKDQINMAEVKYPLDHFKTFNEFFIRELKPGARPIACVGRDDIAVCAADCRLMAFRTAEESLRFWIKGKKFSIRGLLGDIPCSNTFIGGTLVIFRLAPQDYHRFHFPVSGKIEQIVNIPGCLYTVNPIAVNSKYCNVFTENKRAVSIISTADFGKVAFVAIGATMVGSITFTKKKGDYDKIALDEDLLAYSARSIETLVSVGMQLGVSVKKRAELPLPDIKNCVLNA
ncbi:C2 calcium-dependent membrane targeting [Cynara cardunculus var. scolymus]|uniref:C2 calcium-dependent membrane targeting n=1 Tax=Cynara cardunculus var. scolymus TaxID=59895 RepID=A0A103Y3F5_CYNCS|nr:C2 calcium-dependent membrane targeting [Cynara cardunculus var. scolymus]